MQPTLVREIRRVGYQIIRPHLLMTAAVFHYCQNLVATCEVFLDGVIWPEVERTARPVVHGSYALIEVYPPEGYQVDTQVAAETLQDDGEHDTFMQDLREMHQTGDHMQLTQIAVKTHRRIPTRQCQTDVCPATIADIQMGAVLRPKVDLNPHPEEVAHIDLETCFAQTTNNSNDQDAKLAKKSSPATVRVDADDLRCRRLSTHLHLQSDAQSPNPGQPDQHGLEFERDKPRDAGKEGQTTLHHYFSKSGHGNKEVKRPPGQTTLMSYFKQSRVDRCQRSVLPPPSQMPDAEHAKPSRETPLVNLRLADDHAAQAPELVVSEPAPAANQAQQPHPRPAWLIHLDNLFEELATTVHPETGPVLQVEVWYLHHDTFTECPAPRMVELDDMRELWYADLCLAWFDRIVRHQPLRVLNVMPNPPYQMRASADVHVILEQGMHPLKAALHFTAIFLGGTRIGLFQQVESTANHICTQDMIEKHGFQTQCNFRTCNMHSGRLRFMMFDREEIFSGMSAVLSVAPIPTTHPIVGSVSIRQPEHSPEPEAEPGTDETDLMQTAARTRPHPTDQTGSANASNINAPDTLSEDYRIPPHEISEMRQTLMWHITTGPAACLFHMHSPVQVQTWFLDSLRVTHTEESRQVLLQPQPATWHREILARWSDKLEPSFHTQIHVVTPTPLDPANEAAAHVIIVQRPNDLWRAALLVVQREDEPLVPLRYFCIMLDYETSVEQLGFMSLIKHPSNPEADQYRTRASHGNIDIPEDATFPVRHGYSFLLQARKVTSVWDEEVSLIQTQFRAIRREMMQVQDHLVTASTAHMAGREVEASACALVPATVEVDPAQNNRVRDPFGALTFFSTLQALWQPLALCTAPHVPPLVPIYTWFLDHIRYPQNFVSRLVLLPADPGEWIQRIRSVWHDVIIPSSQLYLVVVQPNPPLMEATCAAHVLVVQQPTAMFKATLVTLLDSMTPAQPPLRFATIAPSPLHQSTLYGLAYQDGRCALPQYDCATWVGDAELTQHHPLPVIDGHSLVVAIHVHPATAPDDPPVWETSHPERNHQHQHISDKPAQRRLST